MTTQWGEMIARIVCKTVGHKWAGREYAEQPDGIDMCIRCAVERDDRGAVRPAAAPPRPAAT